MRPSPDVNPLPTQLLREWKHLPADPVLTYEESESDSSEQHSNTSIPIATFIGNLTNQVRAQGNHLVQQCRNSRQQSNMVDTTSFKKGTESMTTGVIRSGSQPEMNGRSLSRQVPPTNNMSLHQKNDLHYELSTNDEMNFQVINGELVHVEDCDQEFYYDDNDYDHRHSQSFDRIGKSCFRNHSKDQSKRNIHDGQFQNTNPFRRLLKRLNLNHKKSNVEGKRNDRNRTESSDSIFSSRSNTDGEFDSISTHDKSTKKKRIRRKRNKNSTQSKISPINSPKVTQMHKNKQQQCESRCHDSLNQPKQHPRPNFYIPSVVVPVQQCFSTGIPPVINMVRNIAWFPGSEISSPDKQSLDELIQELDKTILDDEISDDELNLKNNSFHNYDLDEANNNLSEEIDARNNFALPSFDSLGASSSLDYENILSNTAGQESSVSVKNRVQHFESLAKPLDDSTKRDYCRMNTPPPQYMFAKMRGSSTIEERPSYPPSRSNSSSRTSFDMDKVESPTYDIQSMENVISHFPRRLSSDVSVKSRRSRGNSQHDTLINNTLKVILLGRPECGKSSIVHTLLHNSSSKERLQKQTSRPSMSKNVKNSQSVNVKIHDWEPSSAHTNEASNRLTYSIWDLQGGSVKKGLHYSTHAPFFSSNSLYIIVWDMCANDEIIGKTESERSLFMHQSHDADDDGFEVNMYHEAMARANLDRSIEKNIDDNVLYWIDVVSKYAPPGCAILPVVSFGDLFSKDEVTRRCGLLKEKILNSVQQCMQAGRTPPQIIYSKEKTIPIFSSKLKGKEVIKFRNAIVEATHNTLAGKEIFGNHLGSKVSLLTQTVIHVLNSFKEDGHNIVHVDDVIGKVMENPPPVENFRTSLIFDAFKFLSSIGKILYFDGKIESCADPTLLSQYVILNPSWIASTISCIVCEDILGELNEIRRRNNSQLSGESDISIANLRPHWPIVPSDEISLIWQKMYFVKDAIAKVSASGAQQLYRFLQQVCEHCGILTPITIDSRSYYILPSSSHEDPEGEWSYSTRENWKTTLSYSWSFSERTPCDVFDQIKTCILSCLIDNIDERGMTFPNETTVKVHRVYCWKNSLYAEVIEENPSQNFPSSSKNRRMCNLVRIFVEIQRGRLIVSAQGNEGNEGETIWRLGYRELLRTMDDFFCNASYNFRKEVICPECLKTRSPYEAKSWCVDEVFHSSDEAVYCSNRHRPSVRLLCGLDEVDEHDCHSVATTMTGTTYATADSSVISSPSQNINEIIKNVVVVGLWDAKREKILGVGSGFIADRSKGLIVTAAHTFYKMEVNEAVGPAYYGVQKAIAIVGVYPQHSHLESTGGGLSSALFTYCAEIVSEDVINVDACILRITAKFEQPFALNTNTLKPQHTKLVTDIKSEKLGKLSLARRGCNYGEDIRAVGFSQSGDGKFKKGEYINLQACFSKGYVKKPPSRNMEVNKGPKFMPRSEIVVSCPICPGYSGGPCVNEAGAVMGIVSRTDPVEFERCYLVPAEEIRRLLKEARKKS